MVIKLVLGENCVRARGASFPGCSEEATELRIKQSDHYLQLNIGISNIVIAIGIVIVIVIVIIIIVIIKAGLSPSPRRPSASPESRLKVWNCKEKFLLGQISKRKYSKTDEIIFQRWQFQALGGAGR